MRRLPKLAPPGHFNRVAVDRAQPSSAGSIAQAPGVQGASHESLARAAMALFRAQAGLIFACEDGGLVLRICCGIEAGDLPESVTLLAYSLLRDGARIVADAAAEPQFSLEGTRNLQLGFYAGAAFAGANGLPLGVLFVADSRPRGVRALKQMSRLQTLASLAAYEEELLRLRKRLRTLEAVEIERPVEELRRAHARYALAARATRDGLWDWNLETGQIYYSAEWQIIIGEPAREVTAGLSHWLDRIHPDDRSRVEGELAAHQRGEVPAFRSEHRLRHSDGNWKWSLTRGLVDREDGNAGRRMAGTLTDVTWRQTCDALTGIPNRLAFLDYLERRIEIARETGDWAFSVFFLDLDRFKSVNESLGHAGGDALLAEASRRITRVTQQAVPCSLVARNGGDEFLILAEGRHNDEQANGLYLALERSLNVPFDFRGNRVAVSASIGFAAATESCLHPEDLITDAETAMSQAKNEGKGRCVAFTVGLRERATTRRQLEEDLRCAIESGQMVMHYQPEVDLRTGKTIGFEALVRWQHPQRGLISPSDFIPIAEETGLILPLGYWGLTEACRQILRWRSESTDFDDLRMSVNLSAKQFTESGLVQRVEEVLQQTGLDPCDLRLEVTESSLMSNAEQAVVTMKDLRALGVGLHMDDFGTGYSSLQYLQRFPFDMLKIDRSFIKQICESKESSKIVRTILDLARSLVMDVVAEGIETEAQMRALKGLGCRFGQGFYFSKPQDSATISRSLGARSQDSERPPLLTMNPHPSIGHA